MISPENYYSPSFYDNDLIATTYDLLSAQQASVLPDETKIYDTGSAVRLGGENIHTPWVDVLGVHGGDSGYKLNFINPAMRELGRTAFISTVYLDPGGSLVVGRDTFTRNVAKVSREHVRFSVGDDGWGRYLAVQDLFSTNGTFVLSKKPV